MVRFIYTAFLLLSLALPAHSQSGSSAAGNPVLPADQVAAFSNRVQQDLASKGVSVAIVARMGRDPSTLPKEVTYTHVGFWVYSRIRLADGSTGQGYRVYNLYQDADNSARSTLVQDSPADFFAGAQRLDAGIIIPDRRLQRKLLKVIASPTYAALHNRRYSVLANPNTSRFQNCTEHTLDVLMSSLYATRDTARIKANIAAYFTPQTIPLSPTKRALAAIASRALSTADHGTEVRTATFGSLASFMRANKLAKSVYRVTPTRMARF